MTWVLSLSKGLLRAFNARYAAFSFTEEAVFLDVLPVWSNKVSRFACRRSNGEKPALDLKRMILQWGEAWHRLVNTRASKSYASLLLLKENHQGGLHPSGIRPSATVTPRLTKEELKCLKLLRLERGDLSSPEHLSRIKRSYRRLAKLYHPDIGGDEEIFKHLNEAHRQLLNWAENPRFTSRRALPNCWSYDGRANRWSPPL